MFIPFCFNTKGDNRKGKGICLLLNLEDGVVMLQLECKLHLLQSITSHTLHTHARIQSLKQWESTECDFSAFNKRSLLNAKLIITHKAYQDNNQLVTFFSPQRSYKFRPYTNQEHFGGKTPTQTQ
jgi:hypothetical protein